MTVNFSGSWKANLFRSTFLGPAPSALSVTIEHVDPRLREEIFVIKTDASQDRAVFHCETSNRPGTCSLNGSTVRGTARWEASELVIETWVQFWLTRNALPRLLVSFSRCAYFADGTSPR